MSIELIRTVEHLHETGEESVLAVNIVRPDPGHKLAPFLTVREGEGSIMLHSLEQIDRLHRALRAAAIKAELPGTEAL